MKQLTCGIVEHTILCFFNIYVDRSQGLGRAVKQNFMPYINLDDFLVLI